VIITSSMYGEEKCGVVFPARGHRGDSRFVNEGVAKQERRRTDWFDYLDEEDL
jgi:hypothetical protein